MDLYERRNLLADLMSQVPGRRKADKLMTFPLYGRQQVYERYTTLPDVLG